MISVPSSTIYLFRKKVAAGKACVDRVVVYTVRLLSQPMQVNDVLKF